MIEVAAEDQSQAKFEVCWKFSQCEMRNTSRGLKSLSVELPNNSKAVLKIIGFCTIVTLYKEVWCSNNLFNLYLSTLCTDFTTC